MENKKEKITRLLEEYKKGNISSRDKIIEHYIPYAKEIASQYKGLGVEEEDLEMSAYIGLISAIERIKYYNPAHLTTYIKRNIILSIKQEIAKYLDFRYIEIPRIEIINILIELKELGENLIEEEISKLYTSDSKKKALEIGDNIESLDSSFLSYEKLDTVKKGNFDLESLFIHNETIEELKDLISKSKLNNMEKQVILHRFIISQLNWEELSIKFGVSYSYIRRSYYNALKKLKKYYIEHFLDLASSKDSSERINVRGLIYKRK